MNPLKKKKIYRINLKQEKLEVIEPIIETVQENAKTVVDDVVSTEDTTIEEVVKVGRKKKTT